MTKPKTLMEELDTWVPKRRMDTIKLGAQMFFLGAAACSLLSFWRDPVNVVQAAKLSNVRMVADSAKKISRVIHDGQLKEWVGIGWIDLREPTENDRKKYPTVRQWTPITRITP